MTGEDLLGFRDAARWKPEIQVARIVNVEANSSRSEMITGSIVAVLLIVLVGLRIFTGVVWFRVLAAVAAMLPLGNLARVVLIVFGRQRRMGS